MTDRARFHVKTLRDAIELLRHAGVMTLVPAGEPPSLVEAVIGGPVEGSWWGHAKGKKIYRLGQQLLETNEVLAVKLVQGKVTYVHRALWPVLYRVVMDSTRRRRALEGLSKDAKALLTIIEKQRLVRGGDPRVTPKTREALEQRLLVHVTNEHTPEGKHEAILRSWRDWATPALAEGAELLGYEEALAALRHACGGAASLGPWVY